MQVMASFETILVIILSTFGTPVSVVAFQTSAKAKSRFSVRQQTNPRTQAQVVASFAPPRAVIPLRSVVDASRNLNTDALDPLTDFVSAETDGKAPVTVTERRALLQRCSIAGLSCVSTWSLVKYAGLPTTRACGLNSLMACGLFSPPFAAASLSGAFTGMSGHPVNLPTATLLGILSGAAFYGLERPNRRLFLGRGGRLGTASAVANLFFLSVSNTRRAVELVLLDPLSKIGAGTSVALVAAVVSLALGRHSQEYGAPIEKAARQSLVVRASQALIVALILSKTLSVASPLQHAIASLLACSTCFVVNQSPGVVLPVAIISLIASFFPAVYTAPMALGSFVGMTGLPQASSKNLIKSSFLVSLLPYLGVLPGLGGRFGVFALLAVSFAM